MSGMGETKDPRLARLASQLLAGPPARSPVGAVSRLLAVQAQDERGFRLAVRSRTSDLQASDVDDALSVSRSLLVTWLNRGTLHLVAAEDYWWLHPLTAPRIVAGNERRLRQEGVDEAQSERGVDVIVEAVVLEGPQTRQKLRRRLDDAGVPTAGQALIHLLAAASLRGHIVRGPMVGEEQAYVSVPHWLGQPPPLLDREEALAMLARRYLAGHGPASAQDLAKWAGIALGDARRGLTSIADEVVESDTGSALRTSQLEEASLPPPRLLGAFDPLLHGWVTRELFVGEHGGVVTTNGIFRPIALAEGRAVATWRLPGGVVTIDPLQRIAPGVLDALVDDAADVQRFLGLEPRLVVIR
jgi:hypothetical protein